MEKNIILNNETIGLISAFGLFFILKTLTVNSFIAYPFAMILGFGIALYFEK